MDSVDCIVIGAGVIGLAAARSLAMAGRDVVILEAAEAFGTETSSRNSEVIHAGIYYPPGSLKAALCVQGKDLLYDYCQSHGIAHRRCGKLIVVSAEPQFQSLRALQQQARSNGVDDLQWLDGAQAQRLEPQLRCAAALWSPSTGIIDSHGLMLALLGDAQAHGAMLALRSRVRGGMATREGIELQVDVQGDGEGSGPMRIRARTVINSAGLWAPRLAAAIQGVPAQRVPSAYFCKGNYFACAGRPAFSRLIYPLPERAGLGVHVTLDLAGQMRFGPDTEWITPAGTGIDYGVDAGRMAGMSAAIRRYWPALPDGALSPAYSGVRPKIVGPQAPAGDFVIDGPQGHGVAGLVNLFGIESPGLTASLAMAERVAALVE